MRQLTVVFLLATLFSSQLVNAVNLRSDPVQRMSQLLKEVKDSGNVFGKALAEMVELRLMTGDAVSELQNILESLRQDLLNKDKSTNENYVAKNNLLDQQIEGLVNTISSLGEQIHGLGKELSDLDSLIKSQKSELELAKKSLEIARNKYADLKTLRANDEAAYSSRKEESQKVLSALGDIVNLLEGLLNGTGPSFTEVRNRINKSPVALLVQLTATFSPETVKAVLEKLKSIQNSVSESLKNDAQHEEVALQNFANLEVEFQKAISHFEDLISTLSSSIPINEAERNQKQGEYDAKSAQKVTAEGDLVATKQDKARNESQYKADSAKLKEELEILNKVITIVNENAAKFRKHLGF